MLQGAGAMQAYLLLAPLLVPFAASAAVFAAPSSSRRGCWAGSVAAGAVGLLLLVYDRLVLGPGASMEVFPGIVGFRLDLFGFILGLVALANGVLVAVFSRDYMSPLNVEHPVYTGYPRYYGLLLLFMGAMVGVALASTVFTLFFFYEITGICSCLLIGYYRGRLETSNAVDALVLTHVGGMGLLIAAALLYTATGSTSYSSITILARTKPVLLAVVGFSMLVAGVAKSAQLPLHGWLPRAMVAPTTVSAYLHAASMVKVGVFTFLRFIQYSLPAVGAGLLWPLGAAALAVAIATMYYAAVMYYAQRDLKRLLAYSTISQLSYMFLALGFTLIGGRGVYPAIYHLWNHSFAKMLLFLSVGCMAYGLGSKSVEALRGLGRRRGWGLVAAGWLAGAAAVAGMPPFNCFFSKFSIIVAGFTAGPLGAICSLLAIAESILAFIVFMGLAVEVYASEPSEARCVRTPSVLMKAVLAVLIVLVLVSPALYYSIAGGAPW